MKVVIIEDEPPARRWVVDALARYHAPSEVVAQLGSVADTVAWFRA